MVKLSRSHLVLALAPFWMLNAPSAWAANTATEAVQGPNATAPVAEVEPPNPAVQRKLAIAMIKGEGQPADVLGGTAMLQALADAGDILSQLVLAEYYVRGTVVPADGEKALALYRQAAATGDVRGLNGLGDLLRSGNGQVAKDPAGAMAAFASAAEAGNVGAKIKLADMQVRGEGQAADPAAGLATLEPLAAAGDATALLLLGDYYAKGTLPPDAEKAAGYYQGLASTGDIKGLTRLGDLYRLGVPGGSADPEKAITVFEQAAAKGDSTSQRRLAGLLLARNGSAADIEKAAMALQDATNGGDARAALQLGNLYASRGPLKPDYDKAMAAYAAAIAAGEPAAKVRQGAALANGPLAAQHRSEGLTLLRQSVAEGLPSASVELARVLLVGNPNRAAIEEAIAGLKSGAEKNDAGAIRYLIGLYREGLRKVIPRDIAAAEALLTSKGQVLGAEAQALEQVLLTAVRGRAGDSFSTIQQNFEKLGPKMALQALKNLRGRAPNVFVYLVQTRLTAQGLYEGTHSGTLTSSTISAIQKLCVASNVKPACDRGPLSPIALAAYGPALLPAE